MRTRSVRWVVQKTELCGQVYIPSQDLAKACRFGRVYA